MKLTNLLKLLVTLLLCRTLYVVLSPLAQKAPSPAPREPVVSGKININTAPVDQLASLPGIGTRTAQAIIEYRARHGLFEKANDLTKVRGIGEKTLEGLKKHSLV